MSPFSPRSNLVASQRRIQLPSGGQVVAFTSEFPNHGPHRVTTRNNVSALGTDKEIELLLPQDEAWQWLGEELAENGIGITLFALPQQHADMGTIGETSICC